MKHASVSIRESGSQSALWVGRGLIAKVAELLNVTQHSSVALIADCGASATAQVVMSSLNLPGERYLALPGGEPSKSVDSLARVWEFLTACRLDRRSLVLAVGGGAMTDLVGFAAATYMRGVSFASIPTTLLAQVDASIGGKTGINLAGVKNVVGVIRQPTAVIIDTETLNTLPQRELRSGFAEIIKHGLIADRTYFERVTSRAFSSWSEDELVDILFRSCEIKRLTVESDERESGARKSLNFGHTLGHAIEALALRDGTPITHGEAVSIGMHAATFISRAVGTCSAADLEVVTQGLTTVGLPTRLSSPQDPEELLELMALDKKNVRGESRWTLLNGLGSCVWDRPVREDVVRQAINVIQPSA